MKQTINITFEVSTEIEVDVPDSYNTLAQYVYDNHRDIVQQAKEQIINDGLDKQMTWNNCSWSDNDEVFDVDEFLV